VRRLRLMMVIAVLGSCSGLFAQAAPPENQAGAPAPAATEAQPQAAPAAPASAEGPQSRIHAPDQPIDTYPRKYIDMWNTGNFSGADVSAMFWAHAPVISHGMRTPLKPDLLRTVINAWRKSMPDLTFKIEDVIIAGDKVVMRLSFSGSYKSRLFPNTADPTSGFPRSVHSTEMIIFLMKEGRIAQIWEEYDELRMRLAMGGFWKSNQELADMAAADAQKIKPLPAGEPGTPTPPKP